MNFSAPFWSIFERPGIFEFCSSFSSMLMGFPLFFKLFFYFSDCVTLSSKLNQRPYANEQLRPILTRRRKSSLWEGWWKQSKLLSCKKTFVLWTWLFCSSCKLFSCFFSKRDLYFLKCWEQAFGVLHCPYPVPSRVRSPSTNGNYMSPLRCIIKDQRWSILEISNLIFNHICKCKIMFVVSFVIKKYTRLCMKGLEWEW